MIFIFLNLVLGIIKKIETRWCFIKSIEKKRQRAKAEQKSSEQAMMSNLFLYKDIILFSKWIRFIQI